MRSRPIDAYRYVVSLRLEHPSADPAEFSTLLSMTPTRHWKAGDSRTTKNGARLGGIRRQSFWVAEVDVGDSPDEMNDGLHKALTALSSHRAFFHRRRDEGGSAHFFIGWFLGRQGTEEMLSHDFLALAGDLRIDLRFDVYWPEEKAPTELSTTGT